MISLLLEVKAINFFHCLYLLGCYNRRKWKKGDLLCVFCAFSFKSVLFPFIGCHRRKREQVTEAFGAFGVRIRAFYGHFLVGLPWCRDRMSSTIVFGGEDVAVMSPFSMAFLMRNPFHDCSLALGYLMGIYGLFYSISQAIVKGLSCYCGVPFLLWHVSFHLELSWHFFFAFQQHFWSCCCKSPISWKLWIWLLLGMKMCFFCYRVMGNESLAVLTS